MQKQILKQRKIEHSTELELFKIEVSISIVFKSILNSLLKIISH